MSGIVFVTTPIGNPKDITLKALETLQAVKIIFAEDTRVFKKLVSDLNIDVSDKQIFSFHDHSEEHHLNNLLSLAKQQQIALVSDAGSPLISDPSFPVVKAAIANDIAISSCSGISAPLVALELSGLPPQPFHFHGFPPRGGALGSFLDEVAANYGTHIFFEGVSRVEKTLNKLAQVLPDFDVVVGRELTKSFESIYRFKASEFAKGSSEIVYKGEFVILVHNPNRENTGSKQLQQQAEKILRKGAKPKLVTNLLADILGLKRKEVYEILSRGN